MHISEDNLLIKISPIKRSILVENERYFLNFPYIFIETKVAQWMANYNNVFLYFSNSENMNDLIIPPIPNLLPNNEICMGEDFHENIIQLIKPKILKDELKEFVVNHFFNSKFQLNYNWYYMNLYSQLMNVKQKQILPIWQRFTEKNQHMPLLQNKNPSLMKMN